MTVHAIAADLDPEIPAFEGKEVRATKVKLVSSAGMEIDNAVLFMDDIACMKVEMRCIGIAHVVDPQGHLVRIQTLKVLDANFVPFVEGQDVGIFRG